MKKPGQNLNWLSEVINAHEGMEHFHSQDRIVCVGIRGYFRDSIGVVGVNDLGVFDDALFWVDLKAGWFSSWNGNTDPSRHRKGWGFDDDKGMATLKLGCWRYKPGIHKGYEAFVQADHVTVIRDGSPNYEDTGYFGINIHHASAGGTTSSLGCQTILFEQWRDFKTTGYSKLKMAEQKEFPYILVEKQG